MEQKHLQELVTRYLEKKCTDAELEVFIHLLNEGKLDEYLTEAMDGLLVHQIQDDDNKRKIPFLKKYRLSAWQKYAAAAAILILMLLGYYLHFQPEPQISKINKKIEKDILPGGNKAILTLANGTMVKLNGARNGLLAHQGITAINKKEDGHVVYNPATTEITDTKPLAVYYNTITTPKGGQYQVTLPDGTQVWLNAASSIRFPTQFSGTDRKVEITGELYFEVTKNKEKPFVVICDNQKITVLGTHFNVDAYTDEESIKTTLIEGSVKIASNTSTVVLKPGEQSQIERASNSSSIKVSADVDPDEVIAWKNGLFQFNKADIKTVMRQLSHWYNVDVVVHGTLPPDHYNGKISRNVNASKVLKILELSGIHFSIEGSKIIVTP